MKFTTQKITRIAILSAIATLLMYFLEFPIPFMPPFLKLDFSHVPALLASFAMGPVAGVMVMAVKDLLHLLRTSSGGIGELADFIVGVALILPAGIIYTRNRTKKGALIGFVVGFVLMIIAGLLANKFLILPFYLNIMPLEAIVKASGEKNAAIVDMNTLLLYGIVPFNALKGVIIGLITMLLYGRLKPILK